MPDDLKMDFLYSTYWGLLLCVIIELEVEVKFQFPLVCDEGPAVPQSGKCLANQPHDVLNHAVFCLICSVGDYPFPVFTYKVN